jgi:FlaA1/EpsC-like NDP-sugar epimerase
MNKDDMSQKVNDEFAFSPVASFYEGKTVFITGATGFMGKVTMLHKMVFLYDCHSAKNIN